MFSGSIATVVTVIVAIVFVVMELWILGRIFLDSFDGKLMASISILWLVSSVVIAITAAMGLMQFWQVIIIGLYVTLLPTPFTSIFLVELFYEAKERREQKNLRAYLCDCAE